MTELFPSQEIGKIRTEFLKLGHVGIANSYDELHANVAARQLNKAGRKQQLSATDVLLEDMSEYKLNGKPGLSNIIDSVSNQVDLIDEDLWPKAPNFFLHVEQRAGAEGYWHKDPPNFIGAVAITTVMGNSMLNIEDGHKYRVSPGSLVLLDASRLLVHQGVNDGDTNRVGLVFSVTD
jgi:hypothetical protein